MKELINRFKAETPVFFKKLRSIALAISGACAAMAVCYGTLPEGFSSAIPHSLITHLAVASLVAAGIAQLTKKDTNDNAPVSPA